MTKMSFSVMCGVVLLLSGCQYGVYVKDPKNLTSTEIINVLKNADIQLVATSHSGNVVILLKDDTSMSGIYNSKTAPARYQKCELSDIFKLSAVSKNRVRNHWQRYCE